MTFSLTATTSPTPPPTTASPTDPRCPPPTGFGLCVQGCSSNTDCTNGQICCSNGCGTSCYTPTGTPTTASPTDPRCPPPTGFGLCVQGCSSNTDCTNGQICCSNGCGTSCSTPTDTPTTPPLPTTPTPPVGHCPVISPGTFGACIISCSDDRDCLGGRLCCPNGCGQTCMTPVTTTTTSRPPTSPATATIPTVTCSYGGRQYFPGESFTATDGCNTW